MSLNEGYGSLGFLIVIAIAGFAQDSGKSFEVASLRASDARDLVQQVETSPRTLTMRSQTPLSFVRWAYDVPEWQIAGPDWMGSQHYDLAAKPGNPATTAEMRLMLRALLGDRFKLKAHRERKQVNALVLVETKGGNKLKTAQEPCKAQMMKDSTGVHFVGMPMADFVDRLARESTLPVIDETGLNGCYDFSIDPRTYDPPKNVGGQKPDPLDMMYVLLPEQVGLRFERRTSSVEMLVIDHMEKIPTEN